MVKLLGASKPGIWTGQVLSKVIEWQLEFPEGTKEECAQWLKAEYEAGSIRGPDDDTLELVGKRAKTNTDDSATRKKKR